MNLTSRNHLLELFLKAHPGIVAYIDSHYRYQFLGPSYEKWFGLKVTNIEGKTIEDLLGTEKFLLLKPYLERTLKGERVKFNAFFEHDIRGPIEVEQIYQPDFDQEGKVVGFLAIFSEITEQKKEALYRSMTDLVPQIIWEADPEGNILWFNKNWMEITGHNFEENLGEGWLKHLHSDDRPLMIVKWAAALQSKSNFKTEFRVKTKSGEYRWFLASANPLLDKYGLVIGWIGTAIDINEQRSAQDIAEKERKKNFNLIMQAPIAILVTNGPYHEIELKNEAAKVLVNGIDYSGKRIGDFLSSVGLSNFSSFFDLIYQRGDEETLHSVPFKFKKSNNEVDTLYLDLVLKPIFDSEGRTSGVFCIGQDVTSKVLEKNRATENEIIFKKYAESMPQIAFITDAEGQIIYFNQQWYKFSGSDDQSPLESWSPRAFIHPDDFSESSMRWQHSISTSTPFEVEYRLRRADGVYRWHLGRALPLLDSEGKVTRWVGTDTDIHDQKEIEANQVRLLQIMDYSSDFIGLSDPSGKIIHINSAGKKIIGMEEDLPLNHYQLTDFVFPEDLVYIEKIIIPAALKQGKWVGEFRFRHLRNRKEIWMHFNTFITLDEKTGEISGFATVSRDITEMKQKEKKLEEALKARDQFLSMASHELKTPLTSMKLQAQLNLRNLMSQKEIPLERQIHLANQTNQLVGRLTKLIDDMLDVSRIRTGKLKLDKSQHEMGDIVREVVLRMSVVFEALNLPTPHVNVEEKIIGFWDRFRIEQVIGNLLTNAIRYGKGKPVEVRIRLEDEHVFVSVKDSGYGIAREDLCRIFDRFERASHSSEISGLGLGLFISREIVASHGGQILVESEVDQGSTFHVCLPLMIKTSQL